MAGAETTSQPAAEVVVAQEILVLPKEEPVPKNTSLVTCEWETTGYPHEGCSEFGPPDVIGCTDQAIAWAQLDNEYGAGIGLLLCSDHAELVVKTQGFEVFRLLADRGEGHIDGQPVFGHADHCQRWDMVHACTCHCQLDVYTGGHEDCGRVAVDFSGAERLTVEVFGESRDLWFCQEHADWLRANDRVLDSDPLAEARRRVAEAPCSCGEPGVGSLVQCDRHHGIGCLCAVCLA